MGEAATKEPTMEDILSSIRKIISEEGTSQDSSPEAEVTQKTVVADDPAPVVDQESPSTFRNIAAAVAVSGNEPEENDTAPVSEEKDATPSSEGRDTALASNVSSPGMSDFQRLAQAAQAASSDRSETSEKSESADEPQSHSSEESASVMETEVEVEQSTVEVEPEEKTETCDDIWLSEKFEASIHTGSSVEKADVTPSKPEPDTISVQMADAKPAPMPETQPVPDVGNSTEETEAFRGALMSPSSGDAVSNSFDRLKRSAMDDIEAKTESILRPMLKDWLDENLPTLVERLVREEIERVARGV